MSYPKILRQLGEQQQFARLKANALAYLTEIDDIQAWPLLALAHVQLGEDDEAEQLLLRLAGRLGELDLDARVDLAAVYCLTQHLDEALALLEAALETAPDHPSALARLAWCRLQQGQVDAARQLYRRAGALAPERLPIWAALVRLCLNEADETGAQQALDAAREGLAGAAAELAESVRAAFAAQLRALQLEVWLQFGAIAEAEQRLEEWRSALDEDEWANLIIGHATLLAAQDRHAEADTALREALEHYPQNLPLLSQLAELAQLQGRTQQTSHLLRRAIAAAEQAAQPSVGLWVRLSGACLQQDVVQARQAADKAIALAEAMEEGDSLSPAAIRQLRLQAKLAQARVASQAQQFEVAETLFRELLAEQPRSLPALQGLGHLLMQLGRIDEAVALFERIKALDPAQGFSALIGARRFPEDAETLTRLEQLARQPSLEGKVHSGLLLQLAVAWEKRKDYDRAFALAAEANQASRRFLRYDARAHRNNCARIRHAFCRALFERRRDCGVDSTLPVFVLGMPRSGTTLVEQIIAGHSQIFGAGELGAIPQRIAGLERWERHSGSGRHYPDCIDDLSPYVTAGIARGILDELREYAPEARHVVDKLPHNFENIGLIKFLFPRAKIISVRRDPRDIAISNYFTDYQSKHGGMGFAYDLRDIGEQLADHNLLMHHWHQLFPGEILEIDYEDVVEDLEGSARRMLDYIGVEWEPQVLAFNELERPVKTASVWQVRQPVYTSSRAKWKRYQNHLAPLIQGTNARIEWDPIEMVSLPEPGLLNEGVALYEQDRLDEAEYCLKKLLQHLPEHAAANFMVGLIYLRKGHLQDGIALMEVGQRQCPWNPNWRKDLIRAYRMAGETRKAEALEQKARPVPGDGPAEAADDAASSAQLTNDTSSEFARIL